MKGFSAILIGTFLFGAAAFGFANQANTFSSNKISQYQTALQKAPLLYVLNAKHGSIQPVLNKDQYHIVLTAVSKSLVYFSDRPKRIGGELPTNYLFAHWTQGENNFRTDPPNIALSFMNNGKQETYVFEMLIPKYDSKTDTLSFIAKPLENGLHRKILSQKDMKFTQLFIDFNWHNNVP